MGITFIKRLDPEIVLPHRYQILMNETYLSYVYIYQECSYLSSTSFILYLQKDRKMSLLEKHIIKDHRHSDNKASRSLSLMLV